METEWGVTFNFGLPNSGAGLQTSGQVYGVYIFWKYTSQDDPPLQYTVKTGQSIANTSIATSNAGTGNTGIITPDSMTTQILNPAADVTLNLTPDVYIS